MFNGFGALALDGDHVDLSFRDPGSWPGPSPDASVKSYMFELGDPVAGPVVQLGLVNQKPDEVVDWEHTGDPAHFHGSDQFRVVAGGEWTLAGRPMPEGAYAFQESGRVYREEPGPGGAAWTTLVIGDRRGARPTIIHEDDRANVVGMLQAFDPALLVETGMEYYRPTGDGEAYPHPAGPSGMAAIATTAGPCQRGYLRANFADLDAGGRLAAVSGLFGDEDAGPVAHMLKCGAGQVVAPASAYATERMLIVTGGSCRIGESEYRRGDMRIQQAGAPMAAIVSGPDGLDAAIIVADRRARPVLANSAETPPAWMSDVEDVRRALTPTPGRR